MQNSSIEPDGHIYNQIVCGNVCCQKVLLEWEGEEDYELETRYMVLKRDAIQSYVEFVDDCGQPLCSMPLHETPTAVLGVGIAVILNSRVAGYKVKPNAKIYVEDFCSDDCASQFFRYEPVWGVCLRLNPNGSLTFVTQALDLKKEIVEFIDPSPPPNNSPESVRKGNSMKTHRAMIVPCFGLRKDLCGKCETLITVALDMGTSAFRCPVCNTIYVVDPLQEGSFDTEGIGFSATEIDGHRVEIYTGNRVQDIRANKNLAMFFYLDKVGGLGEVYTADVLSEPGAAWGQNVASQEVLQAPVPISRKTKHKRKTKNHVA